MTVYQCLAKEFIDNTETVEQAKEYYDHYTMLLETEARNAYYRLCAIYNGSWKKSCQCVITLEEAESNFTYTHRMWTDLLEIMLIENITELQGGCLVI